MGSFGTTKADKATRIAGTIAFVLIMILAKVAML